LGRALTELIEKDFSGTINIAGRERLSKLSFGEKLAEVFGLGKANIVASTVAESSLVAKRPLDASLDISKASRLLETELLDARASLEEKKRLLENGFVEKLKASVAV
jgi:dTDP-4-dehydrorhamnose reductase